MTALVATTVSGLTAAPQSATAQNAAARSDAPAQAAAMPAGWAAVVNAGSGKCVDARAAGTAVQQYACNGTQAQQFQFRSTDSGYTRIALRLDPQQVVDVTDRSTAGNAPLQLWSRSSGQNQQWQPVRESTGRYRFVARHSGKCLSAAASAANGAQLTQRGCDGSASRSFALAARP